MHFAQVKIEYMYGQLYVYRKRSPPEIETPTQCNLIGHGMIAPLLCYPQAASFCHLHLTVLSFQPGNIWCMCQRCFIWRMCHRCFIWCMRHGCFIWRMNHRCFIWRMRHRCFIWRMHHGCFIWRMRHGCFSACATDVLFGACAMDVLFGA